MGKFFNTKAIALCVGIFLAMASVSLVLASPAHAETCTWTASSSALMSTAGNWDGCTLSPDDDLLFDGTQTSTGAIWDTGVTSTASFTVSSSYLGAITFAPGVVATTTGNLTLAGGTVAFNTSTFFVGGNIVLGSSTISVDADGTIAAYGVGKDLTLGDSPPDISLSGDFRVVSGADFTLNSTQFGVGSDLIVESGATLTASSTVFSVSGSFTVNGTYTYTGESTTTLDGTGTLGGSGTVNTYDLVIDGDITLAGNVTTTGMLVLTSGTFDIDTYTFTFAKATGLPISVTGGSLVLTSSTIVFAGATSNTIPGTTYNNLVINTVGTMAGNATTTGNLTVNSGKSLAIGTASMVVSGNFSNSGTVTQSASGLTTMTGATKTLGGSGLTTLYDLTISGTLVTLAGNVTTTNNLTVASGKTLALSTYNLILGGNLANSGTVTQSASGLTTMTGATKTLGGSGLTTLYDLTISGTLVTLAGNVTTTNNLTVASGKTLALSTHNLILGGNLANSGTVTQSASGLTTMTGATKTLGGSGLTTLYDLTISGTLVTLAGNVTTTNVLTINSSKSLNAATYTINLTKATGTPLVISGTFTPNASTVNYAGGTSANIASATYYDLTIATAGTLAGNVTSTNLLTINSSESLNAGAYNIVLTDSGTPFVNSGTFTASTSGFSYTSTGSVTTTGATYYTLTLGSGTYLMVADTTSTNAFTNGGTLTIASTKTLVASGDFDNNGVIAETGAIKHGVTSAKITNSAGTETASFNADGGYVYITVQDYDGNLNASAINTITGSVLTEGTLTDSEAITLTETGVDTGIFRSAALPFSVTNAEVRNNSVINVNGNGTLTLTFTDSKDSSDVGTDTATFIAASYAPASSFSGSYTPSTPAPVASPVVPAPVVTPAPSTDEPVANPAVETPTPTAESQPTAVTEDVAVSAKTYQFAKNLSAGFVGAEIRELQQILKDAGYFKYPSITNYFGSVTKAALMAYQNANGLSATGNLDSATRVALNGASVDSAPIASTPSSITFATNLAVGYVGAEVRELQQILKDAGFFKYPFITNYFGPVTKAALVAYQNANGLAASGVLDSATRSDLNGSTVPAVAVPVSVSESHTFTTSMYVGATGAEVSALQQKLKDLGYFTYPTITDYYGPATREAVVKFQKDHNLQPFPGWVGPGTRAALNSL